MRTPTPALWFNRAALRELDRRAVADYHIPIVALMENAGRAVAEATVRHVKKDAAVLVVCGPGNNGGDGLVAARHLQNAGIKVEVMLTAPPEEFHEVPAGQLAIVSAMGIRVRTISADHAEVRDWVVEGNPADVVVDAIFGTGLTREVSGLTRGVISALNLAHRATVAVDIPSGLDCDTGLPLGIAVKATETVSMCGYKLGYSAAGALGYWGKVSVGDIGAPAALLKALAIPAPK